MVLLQLTGKLGRDAKELKMASRMNTFQVIDRKWKRTRKKKSLKLITESLNSDKAKTIRTDIKSCECKDRGLDHINGDIYLDYMMKEASRN